MKALFLIPLLLLAIEVNSEAPEDKINTKAPIEEVSTEAPGEKCSDRKSE